MPIRHIHGTYDGPEGGCPICNDPSAVTCRVCGGFNVRATRCGFCFEPLTRKED